ncbi:hypothetical protein YDYSY3_38200 [Paenibacillus chitinolyticus]|uniref:hypothetical protein n=1 Tax=Paenibacillus chitinolyticus TaxID=79263 RepID=UPI0026E4ED32|nr:hypothetical protein [Paenibacillus chitinolyticus]GKS12820.1 hypothetical protein YDYSY3_38200 [Paenibacillus chitinolyticus]
MPNKQANLLFEQEEKFMRAYDAFNPLPHIMDVEEASGMMNLQPSTIKDLCRLKLSKEGKAIKKGKTWILNRNQHDLGSVNPLHCIMDVMEAAVLWNLAPSTIKDLCRLRLSKEGKAIKKGKTWILNRNQPNPKKIF